MNAKRTRYVSVMLIPDDATTYQFRLRMTTVRILAWTAGTLAVLIILGLVSYWKVARVAFATRQIMERNALLEEEHLKVTELASILRRNQASDRQIRRMAGGVVDFDAAGLSAAVQARTGQQGVAPSDAGIRIIPAEERMPAPAVLQTRATAVTHPFNFNWPIYGGWITREFNTEAAETENKHAGIDIAAKVGTPVKAAANGIINFSGWTSDFGNIIIIDHGNGLLTRYGHNSRLLVEKGDIVRQGKIIAFVGSSGRSSAPHLHFEIWKDGTPANPRDYLLR